MNSLLLFQVSSLGYKLGLIQDREDHADSFALDLFGPSKT